MIRSWAHWWSSRPARRGRTRRGSVRPRFVPHMERCEDRLPPGQLFEFFTGPLGDAFPAKPAAVNPDGGPSVSAVRTQDTRLRAEQDATMNSQGGTAQTRPVPAMPPPTTAVPFAAVVAPAQEDVLTQVAAAVVGSRVVPLTGTLEKLAVQDLDGHDHLEYYLNVGDNRLRLFGNEELEDYQSGDVVTARGVLRPDGLDVVPDGVVAHTPPSGDGPTDLVQPDAQGVEGNGADDDAGTTAVRSVLVINVNFPDRTSQPWTISTANSLFNTTIARWYNEGSYGRMTIAADVVGWYRISSTSQTCATSTWSSQAQAAARARGYEPNNYNHVVIAFPRVPACSWGGLGQVPGRITWLNGSMTQGVATHELGHNLGLAHSKARRCSTGPLGGTCTTTEYGDLYDNMGSGGRVPYHGSYRAYLGWIPTSSRVTVTPATRERHVALRPVESSTGTRVLRVQRTGRSDYLHVEVRQATGFSSGLSQYSSLINGVAVYLGTSLRDQSIIDVGYTTSSASDAGLRMGNILYDRVGNVLIQPYARSNGVTYVYVLYGWAG